jgi:hypothetical protein
MPIVGTEYQQFQQMQPFHQQMWQQPSMGMAALPISMAEPMVLLLLQQQALAMQIGIWADPFRMHLQLAGPMWYPYGPWRFRMPSF